MKYLRNWLSLSGLVIGLGSLFAFLLLLAIDLFAAHKNPYLGILTYVVAPFFSVIGLLLIGFGAWLQKRHETKGPSPNGSRVLVVDLSRQRDRRILAAFLAASACFLLLT